jgi:hypothetical protein
MTKKHIHRVRKKYFEISERAKSSSENVGIWGKIVNFFIFLWVWILGLEPLWEFSNGFLNKMILFMERIVQFYSNICREVLKKLINWTCCSVFCTLTKSLYSIHLSSHYPNYNITFKTKICFFQLLWIMENFIFNQNYKEKLIEKSINIICSIWESMHIKFYHIIMYVICNEQNRKNWFAFEWALRFD